MNPTGENLEFESPTPPLTISPEDTGADKPSNCPYGDEGSCSTSSISPPRAADSNSEGGNVSPITLDSQSPNASQDLIPCSFSDSEFQHGDLTIETPGKRRLKEWLVEQINSGRYEGLKWLTGEKTLFSVPWKHAREKTYCMDKDAALYKEWASYSGKHRKSEANPINWKLNFRCALYSVRGIKERKDVYIRGHRVYELTDSASDTPCKEFPQVPTQIPGFSKSMTETPDELNSCTFEDSLSADIFPRFISNSQGSVNAGSQSSQFSITSKLTHLATGSQASQGDIPPSSPTLRNFFLMSGPTANSHISPITSIPYIDTPTSKFNPLLPSPNTPGLTPTVPRFDMNHEISPSLLIPPLISTGPFKKKPTYPSPLYTFGSTPINSKMNNGSSTDIASTPTHKQISIASPAITSPAPAIAIGFMLPTTPTIPYPIQAPAIKPAPFPLTADGTSAHHYIKTEVPGLSMSSSALRDNLSLSHFLKPDTCLRHPPPAEISEEGAGYFKRGNTSQLSDSQKRSLSASCENIAQLETTLKKRKLQTDTPPKPLSDATNIISTVEMHTCQDPVRIVTSGYPQISGASILDKQKYARDRLDHLRRRLLLKPRGCVDMCGIIPVAPDHPEADLAVLFMDSSGYQSICGHCIISLGRYALDYNLVRPHAPETKVNVQCPCGVVKVFVEYSNGVSGRVRFHSVPAFVYARDQRIDLSDYGCIRYDIAFGGAYYAVVSMSQFKLDAEHSTSESLVTAGLSLLEAVRRSFKIDPVDPSDSVALLGVILVEDNDENPEKVSANIVVCGNRQVARSPFGSSVTARIALQFYKQQIQLGDLRTFRGPEGGFFTGRALREETRGEQSGVVVEVSGHGYYTGSCKFTSETEDPISNGVMLN